MKQHVALTLLVLEVLILQQGLALVRAPRVAIIGGGIGGASASHFLTELSNGTVDIDLYEAKTIGGRLATTKIDKDEFEAGGSIIHPKNKYMQRFVKLLGLEKSPYIAEDGADAIWNGDEFIFLGDDLMSKMKLFWRYGLQIFSLKNHVDNIMEDFVKIYDLQDAGHSFDNATALISATNKDFPKLLRTSTKDYFLRLGFKKILIDELVQATTVVNYGQEVQNIQSFVGCISVAGAGADLWSVKGGNKEVPQHLINRNKNVNVVPSRVTKIRNLANVSNSSQYEVTYINRGSTDPITSNYDIVIIATPLTSDQEFQIEFVGFPNSLVFPGDFQTTYATFVKANLNVTYFDLQQAMNSILSCNPNKTRISSVGKLNPVDGSVKKAPRVWKIFSRESMESSVIHKMFSQVIEKKEIVWKAYPHYSTNLKPNNFKLHDALYHVNAMEWIGSAMEMSAIAGRNVAILAYKDFQESCVHDFMSDREAFQHSNIKKLRMREGL
ncbi:prenylcysteine oxidase-like [Solenopsis invicta]|uniref:prenylcysteine oxidase-like n=1 Tax=Solenopsis invicta TaxID=13686 RepID=UPI0001FEC855|nr:prenylcysteine oxidase-like [Solenopsis invicta]